MRGWGISKGEARRVPHLAASLIGEIPSPPDWKLTWESSSREARKRRHRSLPKRQAIISVHMP